MSNSPFLESSFVLLPLGSHFHTVDFWSTLYEVSPDMDEVTLSQFPKCVSDSMAVLGYPGTTNAIPDLVSLSKGIVGFGRNMLVYRNHRARALLYFKFIQERCYVSLRVVYFQPFSLLKLLRFALISFALILFSTFLMSIEVTTTWYGETDVALEPNLTNLIEGMVTGIVWSAFVFMTWGIWSWWWTGRFLNFLRENFDELYRDDLASIGHTAYNAIVDAADSLSLKALNPQEQPVPTFGLGQVANPTRRQRRI